MKKPVLISAADSAAQKEYINKVRSINSAAARKPLAYVETYGCQQNSSDSERIKGMLCDMGFDFCDNTHDVDFVLYNTCAVRENAELRVFGNIGALKHEKRRRPEMIIGVCGCMMQQKHIAETVKKKYPHVELIFGTHALYKLPELLYNAMKHIRVCDVHDEDGTISEDISYKRDEPPLAKIPIMYGCNNFCTYCVVPYVRGRERSRAAANIIKDAEDVAQSGYKEIMLLGQNVNSYNSGDGIGFPELLRMICRVDGIERVRFMTSHPKDLSDELIEVMATEPKICKQLHLPIQSGSDRILKLMNRKYTRASYTELVNKVKKRIPDIVLTTDIIVGFPGETNEDFEQTMEILREVEYDTMFSFIYSKRVGTPAAEMQDVLTEEEKHRNFDRMLELQNEISGRKNNEYLGKTELVLVEGTSKNNPEALTGRTDGGKVVNFLGGRDIIGKFVNVKITQCRTWSLFGEICD